MSSACLLSVENLQTPRLLCVPKSTFNQRSENMHKEREKCQKRENNNLAIKVQHLCSSSRAVDNVEQCPVSGLIHAETPSGGEVDRMMLTPDDLTTSQSGEGS